MALKVFISNDSSDSAFRLADLFDFSSKKQVIERHTYKNEEQVTLELEFYNAQANAQRPLVVMIHGGSWNSGDYTQLPAINHYLASKGFAVAALTYRLAPEFVFPAQLDDISDALTWLTERSVQFGFNPSCVVLGGRSAGGHLALTAAYGQPELNVRGVFAYYAPNDMNWSWENPAPSHILDTPKTLSEFLGGTPATATTAYALASPYQFVDGQVPPTLLIHGGMDRLVSIRQSRRLVDKLNSLDVKTALVHLPWATHGCDANLNGPSGQISTWAIEQFLEHLAVNDCK
ncbi:MAG: alpha/beta hydrolase [Myxococcota bacterium]|nr:alpha/beta hydrolase [Myxococcota bacterium]